MKTITIEAKDDTPMVILDKENQIFEISGKSLPEDVMEFYQPLYDWLEEYVKAPNPETVFKMRIDYFNSASHKAINDLLDILTEIKNNGNSILIKWHFRREDEDILESGNDYADLTGLDFEYIGYD
jgi:hypothetical protein